MMVTPTDSHRADQVAAWATGVGIGFGVFMVTWIIANRVMSVLMDNPAGAVVAMATAIVAGAIGAAIGGRRLSKAVQPGR